MTDALLASEIRHLYEVDELTLREIASALNLKQLEVLRIAEELHLDRNRTPNVRRRIRRRAKKSRR